MSMSAVPADDGLAPSKEPECRRLLEVLHEMDAASGRRYESGDVLFRRDEEASSLYILIEGVVKTSGAYLGSAGSREATLSLLGPWDVFGHPVFLGRRFREATAEAVTDCEVVKVPGALVKRVVHQHPEIALNMATLLELTLVEYEEVVGCLLPRRTEARLANLFPILARKMGERTKSGHLNLKPRLSRRELAAMVASTRESVTKAMSELREQGAIAEEKKGRIILLDPEKLAEIGRW